MSSPVCKGILCRAYIRYLRKIYKKEQVNYEFKDFFEKHLKKLGLTRDELMIVMPYALVVDFNMG